MRNIVLATLVAAFWLSESAWAQELAPELVPPAVKQAVQARFPTAKAVAWKLKTDKNYEAEFTLKGTEIAAKFDFAGKWLETESAISRSQVPKAVRTAVAKQFAAYKVVERQTVQRCNEERLIYELHLENATEVVKAWLSADGAVLNQSAQPKPAKSTKPEQ
jgi:hypothetical protein